MPIFSFRVAPGLRFSFGPRGVRTHIGPRAARLHVGAGRVGMSTGHGPFGVYVPVTGRPRNCRWVPDERTTEHEQVTPWFDQVANLHRVVFPTVRPFRVPDPEPVDPEPIRERHVRESRSRVPWWKPFERRSAVRAARRAAELEVRETGHAARERHAAEQAAVDAWWAALEALDPDTVLATVEQAYLDNEAPAAPCYLDGDHLTVIVTVPSLVDVPERRPVVTATGKPTTRVMSATQRNLWHRAAVTGHMIAAAKEAFATVPRLNRVTVGAVVNGTKDVVAVAVLTRKRTESIHRFSDPESGLRAAAEQLELNESGRAGTLNPLTADQIPGFVQDDPFERRW